MKIANKISIFFFLLTVFLTTIASSFFYFVVKNDIQWEVESKFNAVLQSRADHIQTYLKSLEKFVGQLSKSVVLEDFLRVLDKENFQDSSGFKSALKRLKRTKEANSSVYEFLLMNKTGKIVVSSNEKSIGLDKSTDTIFLGAHKNIYIKDAYYSEVVNAPLIAVSAPLFDSDTGQFLGVLASRIKLDELNSIVEERTGLGVTGDIYIVNKYGYMITPSRFSKDTFLKQKVDTRSQSTLYARLDKSREHIFSEWSAINVFSDYRGVPVLGTQTLIPKMDWTVLADMDAKEAFASLMTLHIFYVVCLILVPIIAWIFGIVISRIIVGPLHDLRKGIVVIGTGNLNYKVGTKAKDEVGQVARAFDKMAENLKHSVTSVENLNREIAIRKKAEEAIRLSEEKYRTLFTESRDAVMILDPQDGFLSGNPASVKMFGCSDEQDFMSYTPEKLSPKYQPDGTSSSVKAKEMIDMALEKGSNFFEWTHKRLDGTEFMATVLLSRFKISGKALLQANVRDITEQKRAELELKESEEWFSTTLQCIGDAVITTDDKSYVTFINPVAQQLIGYSRSDILGKHIDAVFNIIAEGTGKKAENPVSKVLKEGRSAKLANHTILIAKDGSRCFIDDSAAPIRDVDSQKIIGVVLVFRDVTERNNRERRLRELSLAVEQSPVCVVITDINGNIEYVNSKFEQLTEYSRQEAIGKNPRILKSGEQPAEYYKALWDTITAGNEWRGEFHNKKKNGGFYWESASISPMRNKDGVITNYIGVKEDITERKKTEKALKEATEIKSKFTSMVSHELRSPLAIIKESVSLVLEGLMGDVNDEQKSLLNTAKSNSDRLGRLINNVLDFQKIEAGKMEFELQENNINELILTTGKGMALLADAKGLSMEASVDDSVPRIKFDKDKIIQVVTNLLNNAVTYTEKGNITISTSLEHDVVHVFVRDTGPGIKAEDMPRLFQTFGQLDSGRGRKKGGTGLGLAISKEIVLAHKGKIWAESEVGKGSTFHFTLPVNR